MEQLQQQWQLERGPYLGEVSALCFLHHHSPTGMNTILNEKDDAYSPPPPQFPFPFLLAGTGSEIFLYLLPNGTNIASFQVFEGIRVHGITSQHRRGHCSRLDSDSASAAAAASSSYTIAVFGERRVKLYNLSIVSNGIDYNTSDHWEFTLLHSLPKFTHWVLDVCFLESGSFGSDSSNHQGGYWLAIGCSDNSVWFWDILSCHVVSQVRCPDRCLLYSMRMWGSNVESLLIASGTIYNQIIVWKLDFENHSRALTDHVEGLKIFTTEEADHFCGRPYQVVYLCRLTGHEGSIFRIAWSLDGSKLVSASDDRSARVWVVNTRGDGSCSPKDIDNLVGPVLFGHSARVWDCCIFNNLIVTAGEDCTCRVWGQAGHQLKVIKEHIGRGVWRCLYDPITSVIVTAGLDSALKVYQIHSSSSKSSKGCTGSVEDSLDRNEIFKFSLPNSSGKIGLTDSKSEYVRCLHFSCENSLYVSTNNGYLHHIPLDTGEEKWTELVHLDEGAPVVCMDLLSETSKLSDTVEDWIAMGNGKGSLMVVRVVGHIWSRKVNSTLVWSAETERQLLGTYWCKSLGNRFIFTADPRGQLKLWRLWGSLPPDCESADLSHRACLIATYISCFGARIMCLDASAEDEVLVCGDIRGNILLFTLSRSLLSGTFVPSEVQTSPVSYFKGAHGISSVCSISIISSSVDEVEICSTGQDGCICSLEFNKIWQSLEFLGMKSVKELSVVRSVFWNGDRNDDLEFKGYAVGFTSSDFIIWNLTADTKVLKVACGGWRRPHSFYIGNFPETNTCFAFVKNEIIYVHRNWLYKREKELYPQNLHLQFHGREIHSVCFIMKASEYGLDKNLGVQSKTIGIATGSEDGTVRLSRYEPGSKNWVSSTLLGEHVGGSAVRSLYCVSKMHIVVLDVTCLAAEVQRKNETLEEPKNPLLLISVGAKRVVTAWKQRLAMRRNREEDCFHGSSFSFQWLSSDMPTKDTNHAKRQNTEIEIEGTRNAYTKAGKFNVSADVNNILKDHLEDKCEDDWRYLAVTAFLVKVAESRISVCFVVVASSDATVTLRALLLPYRLWFDVAILSPSSSPVLALQNVVESISPQIDDNILVESIYIVISGSTDGSITFWDLTKDVYDFLRQVSSLDLKDLTGSHKRPRTGRGSQGGRWRRTICGHVMKKKPGGECKQGSHFQKEKKEDDSLSDRSITKDEKHLQNHTIYRTSGTPFSGQHEFVSSEIQDCAFVSEENADYPYTDTGVGKIAPLHVVNSVHQSGVNCLYVSNRKDMEYPENKSIMYYVLSGGDDQALNCLRFELVMKAASQKCQNSLGEENSSTVTERVKEPIYSCQIQKYVMNVLPLEKVMSAHGSAVKGVWSDGSWAFSTGLDQRIRCWKFDQLGKLIECAHLIVSVPEPEAIDAHCCGRGRYQIIQKRKTMFKFLKGVVGGSGAGIKDLPYNIGEPYSSAWGSWVHCRGTSKDDGAPVSIFSLQGSNANDGHLAAGRNGVKRLRTVRHPNILSFLHSSESETVDGSTTKVTIYIVTEPVMPLSEKIKELGLKGTQRDEYFAWGLHRIAKAVSFLNNDCKLVHGNVCMASVVVTQTLDWKLHAFDVLSEFDGNNEASTGPMLQYEWLIGSQYKPMELQKSDWKLIRQSPPWSIDSWGLGCFIYELFSGTKLVKSDDLRNTASIPKSLLPDYPRLLSSTPSRRLNSSKLLESEYFENKLVETIHFMEILNLKDSVEKDTFFRKLPSLAEQLPREIVLKKLLPLLASALEFGSAAAPALTAFLKLGAWLPTEEFGLKVLPTVVKLFASNDRAIRVGLLQHIDQFGESLSSQVVDEQVYPHVSTGFSDTSSFLRELTLKSMLVLAPKLSQRTISGSLLKYLSKLQVDEEPAIRTNTTILLGNIASHLNEGMRKRVLINAFTVRALRDTFSPARGAGIMALCATSSYYDVTEIATRILPNLVVLTIDPDSEVQSKAFQAVEQFLQILRQNHEKTNAGDITGTASTGSFQIPGNAGLLGWAMSSLTLKGKPSEQVHDSSANSGAPHSSAASNSSSVMDNANLTPVNTSSSSISLDQPEPVSPTSTDGWGDLENGIDLDRENDKDGWDDIEPLEDPKPSAVLANIQAAQKRPVVQPKPQVTSLQPKNTSKVSKAEDDDLWGSIAAPPPKSTSKPLRSTSNEAINDDDPWGAIAAPVPQTSRKPSSSRSSDSLADSDDPWAAIAAPAPTTRAKPLSAGRGRGTKPVPTKLGAQRINRTSSGT